MPQIEISAFFTRGGAPATDIDNLNPHSDGKNYPRVRVWEVDGSTFDLVIGDGTGSGQNTDGLMIPVEDGVEDGFYSFVFTDLIGFNQGKKYLIRADGGPSLPPAERLQVAQIDPVGSTSVTPVDIQNIVNGVWNEQTSAHIIPGSMGEAQVVAPGGSCPTASQIADAVWDEQSTDHLIPGSMGAYQNEIHADTQQLRIDMNTAISLVTTLLKYEKNRTRIDKVAMTLTVYDDNGTTILKVFDLKDSTGNPSVTEVCERVPRP